MTGHDGAHQSSPATQGCTNRRAVVQADSGIKQDPLSKGTNAKKDRGIDEVVEHTPRKHKTLSSRP
jgi:hypothetical protein